MSPDDEALAFFDEGLRDAFTLFLLHDLGLDGTIWSPQVAHFVPDGFRVVVPDLSGHGESPPPLSVGVEGLLRPLRALLDGLDIRRCAILAQGAAAPLSLKLGASGPKRIAGVALVGPAFEVASYEQKAPTGLSSLSKQKQPHLLHELEAMWRKNGPAAQRALASFPQPTDPTRPSKSPTPLMIAHGADDSVVPISKIVQMKVKDPTIELRILSGCGHYPSAEAPEAFDHVLEDWLGQLGAPSRRHG